MSNFCYYELKAKGPEEDLKSLVSLFKTEYNYTTVDGVLGKLYEGPEGEFKEINEELISLCEVFKKGYYTDGEVGKICSDIYGEIKMKYGDILKSNSEINTSLLNLIGFLKVNPIKDGFLNPPEKDHLLKIFSADEEYPENGTLTITGDCSWSAGDCMFSGGRYFKRMNNKEIPENIYRAKPLDEWIKKHPSTIIEIISQENGECFSERYLLENGQVKSSENDSMYFLYINCEDDLEEAIETAEHDIENCEEDREFHYQELLDELSGIKKSIESDYEENEDPYPFYVKLSQAYYLTPNDDFRDSCGYKAEFTI